MKRLYAYRGESLVSVDNPRKTGARMLVAVTRDGCRTDYPTAYANGQTGWDNPEYFSRRFKDRAARHILAFRA